MREIVVKARDLRVGDFFVDYDYDEDEREHSGEFLTVTSGNGIVRFTTAEGSGYFDENSDVVIRR